MSRVARVNQYRLTEISLSYRLKQKANAQMQGGGQLGFGALFNTDEELAGED